MAYTTAEHQREKKQRKKENEEKNIQWSLHVRKVVVFFFYLCMMKF